MYELKPEKYKGYKIRIYIDYHFDEKHYLWRLDDGPLYASIAENKEETLIIAKNYIDRNFSSSEERHEKMKVRMVRQDNGKYTLFGKFEIGNSGEYTERVLVSNLSKSKAEEMMNKYN